MGWLIMKYLTTAFVVVLVSEIAKRSDKLGALVAALPLVTILALIWLHIETGSAEKVSSHALYTFWYVIPTLPMFLVFPSLLPRLGFWGALVAGVIITVFCFWLFSQLIKQFGIDLNVL
ncbi:MAG: DUF3147 family protein [Gammaproteobacteria bacterium]|nr:DUF3147 family protein [Gammaproteobacteria bacterium]